jgi:hypothetical protein
MHLAGASTIGRDCGILNLRIRKDDAENEKTFSNRGITLFEKPKSENIP